MNTQMRAALDRSLNACTMKDVWFEWGHITLINLCGYIKAWTHYRKGIIEYICWITPVTHDHWWCNRPDSIAVCSNEYGSLTTVHYQGGSIKVKVMALPSDVPGVSIYIKQYFPSVCLFGQKGRYNSVWTYSWTKALWRADQSAKRTEWVAPKQLKSKSRAVSDAECQSRAKSRTWRGGCHNLDRTIDGCRRQKGMTRGKQ